MGEIRCGSRYGERAECAERKAWGEGKFPCHKEEKAKDRELQLIQALMNKQTEQTSDNTNNIKNEEVDNSETVDNNVDNVDGNEEDLIRLIEHIMSLPQEEQQALLQQYPELAQVMSLIEQGTPTM